MGGTRHPPGEHRPVWRGISSARRWPESGFPGARCSSQVIVARLPALVGGVSQRPQCRGDPLRRAVGVAETRPVDVVESSKRGHGPILSGIGATAGPFGSSAVCPVDENTAIGFTAAYLRSSRNEITRPSTAPQPLVHHLRHPLPGECVGLAGERPFAALCRPSIVDCGGGGRVAGSAPLHPSSSRARRRRSTARRYRFCWRASRARGASLGASSLRTLSLMPRTTPSDLGGAGSAASVVSRGFAGRRRYRRQAWVVRMLLRD